MYVDDFFNFYSILILLFFLINKIIGICEVFETDSTLYLVLELVTGGELFELIVSQEHFTEDLSRDFFLQMLEATQYLHKQGFF